MKEIYVAITPTFSTVTRYASVKNYHSIYDKIMFLTNDHATAENVASWASLASVGEIYYGDSFTAVIIED